MRAFVGCLRRFRERSSTQMLVLAALSLYLAFRALDVPLILWIAHHQDPSVLSDLQPSHRVGYWDMTRMWDGQWYERIATNGYRDYVPRDTLGRAEQSELAFYPLFPMLVRAGMALTGAGFAVVGSMLSLVFGAVAMVFMALLLRRHIGGVAALCTVAVVASCPPALTFQMTYTESLAMLLLVSLLWALREQRWGVAGLLGIAIGFERPIGLPLAIVVAVVLAQRWRARDKQPLTRSEGARMTVALIGVGLSGAIWPVCAAFITGVPNAYSETMSAWRGHQAITPFASWFETFGIFFVQPWAFLLVLFLLVGTAAMILGPWAARLKGVLRWWCGAYALYLFATVVPWSSTLRYLVELFPLAAVLIGAGWKRRSDLVPPMTVLVVMVNVGASVWWCWNFLRFVPPYGNPV